MTKTTPQQLRRAVLIIDKIEALEAKLNRLLSGKGESRKRRLAGARL